MNVSADLRLTFCVVRISHRTPPPKDSRRAFDAVEAGVPTTPVNVIAGATGEAANNVMDVIGLSQTTFRPR